MSIRIRSGLFRILLSLVMTAGLWGHDARAATVRWEVLPDRERVTVTLSAEEGFAGEVTRVSRTGLLLELGVPTSGLGQDMAPENARFFRMSEPRGRALGFFMKTAAFGFVVTRPNKNTVIINAYEDPLGARWTPQGPADVPGPEEEPPSTSAGADGQESAPSGADASARVPSSAVRETSDTAPAVSPDAGMSLPPAAESPPTAAAQGNTVAPDAQETANRDASSLSARPDTTVFRSRLNPGGLSDWEDMHPETLPVSGDAAPSPSETSRETAETQTPAAGRAGEASSPASSETSREIAETRLPAAGQPGMEDRPSPTGSPEASTGTQPPAKVYVDAEGNPVPPPADPVELLADINADIRSASFKSALDKARSLLLHPELTREQTEEALHLHAELLFMANQDALMAQYDAIVSATITALNYNPDSARNPAAILRLGYVNLRVGNTVEADVYFNRLRRQYPRNENIPLTYYYWGEHFYDKGEMQKAADEFQYIISNHAESQYARDAAIGLARSYVALGYYQEAFDIIDYIERRWPRLYLESPAVLELMGDVGYRLGNLDFALDKYMTYYNLVPDGPNADVILTRIGDVFARKRQLAAAKAAYTKAETLFPDKDGGLVAMMRLAETGINDMPELQTMVSIFHGQGTSNFQTVDIYKKIIREHPESELVPLAQLKLAMWYLANTQYEDALAQCTELVRRFPQHELVPRAEEVAMKAFEALAEEGALRNRSEKVIASWRESPILLKQEETLAPGSRVALAHSMWKQGDPDGAMEMIAPMFLGAKDPIHAEEALLLALTIDLDHDQWEAIEKLGEQVALWELTDKTKEQLDYALALARENLGKSDEAAGLWSRVAETGKLDQKQQAYAEYFLAKDAENDRRLQDAYTLGRSALNRFLQLAGENPEQADTGKINSLLSSLMDICETSGRFKEALEYANRYMEGIGPDDPQRQGLLFRIAGIYRKQGNTPEWRKALKELAEKYPDSVHGRAAASTLRGSKLAEDAAQFAPGGQL